MRQTPFGRYDCASRSAWSAADSEIVGVDGVVGAGVGVDGGVTGCATTIGTGFAVGVDVVGADVDGVDVGVPPDDVVGVDVPELTTAVVEASTVATV